MTVYQILVEPAGKMHEQPEPGGLGWRAREISWEADMEDYSSVVMVEEGKVYLTKELIKVLGKEQIQNLDKIHLGYRRYAYELCPEDWMTWVRLNDYTPRGHREEEVKNRNAGLLEFLGQLLKVTV